MGAVGVESALWRGRDGRWGDGGPAGTGILPRPSSPSSPGTPPGRGCTCTGAPVTWSRLTARFGPTVSLQERGCRRGVFLWGYVGACAVSGVCIWGEDGAPPRPTSLFPRPAAVDPSPGTHPLSPAWLWPLPGPRPWTGCASHDASLCPAVPLARAPSVQLPPAGWHRPGHLGQATESSSPECPRGVGAPTWPSAASPPSQLPT